MPGQIHSAGSPGDAGAAEVTVIDGYHDVPAADATANAQMRDVIGNKSDAAQTVIGTTRSIIAYIKGLLTRQAREVHRMDFWSDLVATVTVTATAADISLPNVTVEDIPAGATVLRAEVMMKFRTIKDTSTADNKLDDGGGATTPAIQVRADTPGTYIDGIKVVDSTLAVVASTIEGGDFWIGNIDVSSEVDGNDTYNLQWDDAEADGNNLILNDVMVGLRVYWTL